MNLFKSKTQHYSLVCKICGLEFLDSERTYRHMLKAHSKPCKDKK